jgi:predicted nucleic acid-binding protein
MCERSTSAVLPPNFWRTQRSREIRIDISKAVLDETIGVLREKFKRDPYTLNDIRQKLNATCNFIASTGTLDVVKEDPDDNRILECAEAAHSDYVVSEVKDLLRLGLYGEIRIVDINSFLAITAGADDAHKKTKLVTGSTGRSIDSRLAKQDAKTVPALWQIFRDT